MTISSAPQAPSTRQRAESGTPGTQGAPKASWFDRASRSIVFRRLEKLTGGRIVVRQHGREWTFGRDHKEITAQTPPLPLAKGTSEGERTIDQAHTLFPAGPHPSPLPDHCVMPGEGTNPSPLTVTVEVHDSRFYRQVVFGGSLGAADAYIRGDWDCDDLVGLVQIFCRNMAALIGMETGWAKLLGPWRRLGHLLRRNTLAGSQRNIAAHYDLGDDFFRLLLDETMAYSCAIFPRPESTLHEASLAKFERICRNLDLKPSDHLLEIGGGWGGLAVYAAQRFGCRVTTTTVSQRQFAYAQRLVDQQGLTDRIRVLCKDYRRLQGTYDKLASIEMIEAVGAEYFDTFFRACSERLKPDGAMLLQAIVIPDQRFAAHRRGVDFIQRYIFPGGCLPSLGAICRAVGRATDMQIVHLEDLTPHYPRTLAAWRKRFWENAAAVRALGFDDAFLRTWNYYFCYCEGGFRERTIGDVQILLAKPQGRPPSPPL